LIENEEITMGKHEEHPDEGVEGIVLEIVELEEHARTHAGEAPHAKHYAFRVDKQRVVVDHPEITGKEILASVGKTPEQFKLYQHKRGHQPIRIEPDEIVNLRAPGVERFTTMPKDTTEGRENVCLRQDFRLPEAEEAHLNSQQLQWEAVLDQGNRWLIIRKWKLPPGYNCTETDLALLIPANYSDSQIDMVYFSEHLARTDGVAIRNLSDMVICGAKWQRWSRHRTPQNPWRPGIDDVGSHLGLVDDWLRREFEKR
jgi:Prokaryotic E2 family E/Multiubiquitin